MLTNRQRSFIATVEVVDGTLHFLDVLHSGPAELEKTSTSPPGSLTAGGLATAGFASRTFRRALRRAGQNEARRKDEPKKIEQPVKRDESHYLGHVSNTVSCPPLKLYFRRVDNGYRLFVRSEVRHGHALYIHDEDCVGAFRSPLKGAYPTLFDLLDCDDTPIPFEDLADQAIVRLAPAGRRTPLMLRTFNGVPFTYICKQGQQPLELRLNILERNAAYLNDPDEI
ncbi:hypothetical protein OSW16_04700 [Pseudomonas putida]|uniref:hypothetical protein n=1 Tax=Pseudomonas putida TaxID=303 RepID=UPI001F517E94|nr:hypothetical protein [Pseudomonas putida]MCI0912721.1 hypothetical protein [Pseudomonas putida]WAB98961.1 hypothetical protein OSW16_04700 [Pseudomonas putida]